MDAILAPLAENKSFQSVAGIASILSLLVTGFVALKLRRISAQLIYRQRAGSWQHMLKEEASQLSALLNDPAQNRATIRELLAESRPTVLALHRCLPHLSFRRMQTARVLGKMSRYLGTGWRRWFARRVVLDELPRAIYEEMLEVSQTLKEDVEQGRIFQPQV